MAPKDAENGNAASIPSNLRNHVLDDIDYAILRILQEGNNHKSTWISEKLGGQGFSIQAPAVTNRIAVLRLRKYISHDRSILNYEKFGLSGVFLLFARVSGRDAAAFERFIDVAKAEPNILAIYEVTGNHDYVLKVVAPALPAAAAISKRLHPYADIETISVSSVVKDTTCIPVERAP